MADLPNALTTLAVGQFKLLTPWETVVTAYVNDRELTFACQGGPVCQEFKAVVRFSNTPFLGYHGHTTDPRGFNVSFDPVGEYPSVEISISGK